MIARNPEKTTSSEDIIGVSGWLLLFCVIITILSPLRIVYPLIKAAINRDHDVLVSIIPTTLSTGPEIMRVVFYGIIVYGIVVGIMLWLVKPNAPLHAKIYLIAVSAANVLHLVLSIVNGSKLGPILLSAMRSIIPFALWWSYFSKSIRVRNTYLSSKKPRVGKAR